MFRINQLKGAEPVGPARPREFGRASIGQKALGWLGRKTMKKNALPLAALMLVGCAGLPPELGEVLGQAGGMTGTTPLGEADIAAGLKEALAVGTERAVERVGTVNGYWGNAAINI